MLNNSLWDSSNRIAKVACGASHVLALDSSGNLFAWGLNLKGQLGLGDYVVRQVPTLINGLSKKNESDKSICLLEPEEQVKEIAGGSIHSIVLTTKNRVFAFG